MRLINTWTASNYKHPLFIGLGLFAISILVLLMSRVLPDAVDWSQTYRPATQALISLNSPYATDVAPNAPFVAATWGLIPLIPLALLPLEVGRAILLLVSITAFAYTARKLGANNIGMTLFLLSPPVLHCLLCGNVDWMPLLGFVLPPQIGLFFVAVKPQTGFAVAIFWLFEAWKKGGIRHVTRTFLPVSIALLASFVIFGLWPLHATQVKTIAQEYNASLWPISIPVGLAMIVAAIHRKQAKWAMAASPFLSPYVLFYSWSGALVALSSETREFAAVVLGLWILGLLQLI